MVKEVFGVYNDKTVMYHIGANKLETGTCKAAYSSLVTFPYSATLTANFPT